MGECKKCGMTLGSHIEEECDFVPIDWDNIDELTAVEDIEIKYDMPREVGYGLWEQVILTEIMTKLYWKSRNSLGGRPLIGMDLFYETKKIYDKTWK